MPSQQGVKGDEEVVAILIRKVNRLAAIIGHNSLLGYDTSLVGIHEDRRFAPKSNTHRI